jgi:Ca-activated chloride channel family protein
MKKLKEKNTKCIDNKNAVIQYIIIGTALIFSGCQTSHQGRTVFLESEKSAANEVFVEEMEAGPDRFNTEEYDRIYENEFLEAKGNPLSTFSIDVDNASYSNVRRFLQNNQLPPKDAVRIEEMINYFSYSYPKPEGKDPFALYTEVGNCPWNSKNLLVHIGIQGKKLNYDDLKPSNLVFLLDVSGSMSDENKLGLIKKSMKMMLEHLDKRDKISIVVYAGAAGAVLPSTPADEKKAIIKAFDKLEAGGSTAGGEGIELAYKIAKENLISGGNNRIILCTDGDFNIGTSSTGDLVRLIEEKRKDNIYLTICGYGMGNYKDGRMEQISNAGNGNYFYIDNIKEAEKVFVKELRANMFTIAKDVKIQVEFNPAQVHSYRLIGYENRMLAKEDFNDDTKDAGELGAGHTVTAIYEIVPAGKVTEIKRVDDLKYQETKLSKSASAKEILTLKLRYKPIGSNESLLVSKTIENNPAVGKDLSSDFKFSASVAAFGMLLRGSEFKGEANFQLVKELAKSSEILSSDDYKNEYLGLVKSAELLSESE